MWIIALYRYFRRRQCCVLPEQSVVVWMFSRSVTVSVALRDKSMLFPEAFSPFGYNSNTLSHPLTQAFPPLLSDHSNYTNREADRRRTVRVADGQTREDPDVAWPQQAHLCCLCKQVLCLLVGAVSQEDLSVHLQRGRNKSVVVHSTRGHNSRCFQTSHLLEGQLWPDSFKPVYLLQHAFGSGVIGSDWHFQSQNVLQVPQEVGCICVRLHNVYEGVVSWQKAGDHHKLSPIIFLHELEQWQQQIRIQYIWFIVLSTFNSDLWYKANQWTFLEVKRCL